MEPTAVPRDHFRASILLVLGEAPTHGYDLPVLLAPLGLGATDRGFVYRTLRAMEADGLVASAWDPSPTGPARRTYAVTPAGREWSVAATSTLREADGCMATWLARYRALRRRGGPQAYPGVPAAS
ncbi:MAG TPA: helix-turn-helix transcriptional regulator [Acidimicrobiales bacterium]|nr:helix-turn-helix transcriptional regulator [Acidimicrobiales bacterium]